MAVALAGSGVMMAHSYELSLQGLLGDALALSASGFYAGCMMTAALARRTAPVVITMVVSMTVSAAILAIAAAVLEKDLVPHSTHGWLVVAAMALLVQVGGQTLVTLSLAHVPTNLTALMFLIQPMIPAAVAWYMFGERITALQIAGAVLVLVGLEIARRAARAR
jgi:drug/metabolite transporter (DMT)-like permease